MTTHEFEKRWHDKSPRTMSAIVLISVAALFASVPLTSSSKEAENGSESVAHESLVSIRKSTGEVEVLKIDFTVDSVERRGDTIFFSGHNGEYFIDYLPLTIDESDELLSVESPGTKTGHRSAVEVPAQRVQNSVDPRLIFGVEPAEWTSGNPVERINGRSYGSGGPMPKPLDVLESSHKHGE